MNNLVLIRHGQSTANSRAIPYSYPDSCICLTTLGVQESIHAGQQLLEQMNNNKLNWDEYVSVFTSEHIRAKQTARICLDIMGLKHIQPIATPALSERLINAKSGIPDESVASCLTRFLLWYNHHARAILRHHDVVVFAHGELITAILDGFNTNPIYNAVPIFLVPDKAQTPFAYVYDLKYNKTMSEKFTRYDDSLEHTIR